jgi:hypothetical protein
MIGANAAADTPAFVDPGGFLNLDGLHGAHVRTDFAGAAGLFLHLGKVGGMGHRWGASTIEDLEGFAAAFAAIADGHLILFRV